MMSSSGTGGGEISICPKPASKDIGVKLSLPCAAAPGVHQATANNINKQWIINLNERSFTVISLLREFARMDDERRHCPVPFRSRCNFRRMYIASGRFQNKGSGNRALARPMGVWQAGRMPFLRIIPDLCLQWSSQLAVSDDGDGRRLGLQCR